MSSPGHLSNEGNKDLVFKEKPNNMGLYLGKVQKYNSNKGYITVKLNEPVEIGDTISLEKEDGSYTISELMDTNMKNIKHTEIGQTVIIGRMKGNIKLSNNIYKMSSKKLNNLARESYSKENRKILLNCQISIKKNKPIQVTITSACNIELYKDLKINYVSDIVPLEAKTKPLDKNTVINQFSKTTSTPYAFKKLDVDLDYNLFIPKLSTLNDLRRTILTLVEQYIKGTMKRNYHDSLSVTNNKSNGPSHTIPLKKSKISLLLNILHTDFDYSKIGEVENVYIPLKYFSMKEYKEILHILDENLIYTYICQQ